MPPIRSIPTVRPIRTERTHEENQERAYIAASRRSDRSLEARVESARRASEIHKKRTGRSLRVREEDVMNEEMYEEEDDDLPMQFRRINALHPGLAYDFSQRMNNYVSGQLGVRQYLHQAIFQANQANQYYNPMMNQGTMSPAAVNAQFAQSPWANMQNMQQSPHGRSASIATPDGYAQAQNASAAPSGMDNRRMTLPMHTSSSGRSPPAATSSHASTPHPLGQNQHKRSDSPLREAPDDQKPLPGSAAYEQSIYPLTTKLPIETQQILDGSATLSNAVYPSQMTPGIPMPSRGAYSYNPNGKGHNASGSAAPTGLYQTLAPYNMHTTQDVAYSEPQSAVSAPADFDFGCDSIYDVGNNYDYTFNFGDLIGGPNSLNSGQISPASNAEPNWSDVDFFQYTE